MKKRHTTLMSFVKLSCARGDWQSCSNIKYQNGESREQCEVTVAGTDPSATRLKPVENGVVRTGIVGD